MKRQNVIFLPFCVFLYKGIVISIIPNTTIARIGIVHRKINAHLKSIVKAIIIAPNTTKGERKNNLKNKFIPDCTWLISDVILVINVDVPILSILEYENDCI